MQGKICSNKYALKPWLVPSSTVYSIETIIMKFCPTNTSFVQLYIYVCVCLSVPKIVIKSLIFGITQCEDKENRNLRNSSRVVTLESQSHKCVCGVGVGGMLLGKVGIVNIRPVKVATQMTTIPNTST